MREYHFNEIEVKSAAASVCPFDLSSAGSGASFSIRVKPGTIGGKLISNYDTNISCSETGTRYIVINASTNGKWITAATVAVESTMPDPQTPTENAAPSTVKALIGLVVNKTLFKLLGCVNIVTKPVVAYVIDKTPPVAPGTSPLRYFYIWDGI
jgi:hypothetical protein